MSSRRPPGERSETRGPGIERRGVRPWTPDRRRAPSGARKAGVIVLAALLLLAACARSVTLPEPPANSPFRSMRSETIPPPSVTGESAGQHAPPEGVGSGGIDFGAWRKANPAVYGYAFEAQMRTRYAGKSVQEARTDLEANGFSCGGAPALQCRIEIMEADCAKDWYVVFESGRTAPAAGFDVMCLGAR